MITPKAIPRGVTVPGTGAGGAGATGGEGGARGKQVNC